MYSEFRSNSSYDTRIGCRLKKKNLQIIKSVVDNKSVWGYFQRLANKIVQRMMLASFVCQSALPTFWDHHKDS